MTAPHRARVRPRAGRRCAAAVVTLLLALAAASGCAPAGPSAAAAAPGAARESGEGTGSHVTGYVLAGAADPSVVTRDGDLVDTVGVDGVALRGASGRVSSLGQEALALRDAADRAGRRTTLLVSNFSDRLGDFDEPLAHRVLSRPGPRARLVRSLAAAARGFDGLQVDLESLRARDRAGLVALMTGLRRALPDHQLSIAFMSAEDAAGYRALGYDLPRLAPLLDSAVLMTYDQHGPWSGPGPVASLPWVRRQLTAFVAQVPREKVDLGVAGYGYQWGGEPDTLTVARARELAGSRARWSEADAEWHATLADGATLWWDDARSFEVRRELAVEEGLRGVAVWQLGSSGPLLP